MSFELGSRESDTLTFGFSKQKVLITLLHNHHNTDEENIEKYSMLFSSLQFYNVDNMRVSDTFREKHSLIQKCWECGSV